MVDVVWEKGAGSSAWQGVVGVWLSTSPVDGRRLFVGLPDRCCCRANQQGWHVSARAAGPSSPGAASALCSYHHITLLLVLSPPWCCKPLGAGCASLTATPPPTPPCAHPPAHPSCAPARMPLRSLGFVVYSPKNSRTQPQPWTKPRIPKGAHLHARLCVVWVLLGLRLDKVRIDQLAVKGAHEEEALGGWGGWLVGCGWMRLVIGGRGWQSQGESSSSSSRVPLVPAPSPRVTRPRHPAPLLTWSMRLGSNAKRVPPRSMPDSWRAGRRAGGRAGRAQREGGRMHEAWGRQGLMAAARVSRGSGRRWRHGTAAEQEAPAGKRATPHCDNPPGAPPPLCYPRVVLPPPLG